jgi:hypothetical protein
LLTWQKKIALEVAPVAERGGRTIRYNITAGDRSSVVVQGTGQAYRGPRLNFSASLSRCCGQEYHHLVSHGAPDLLLDTYDLVPLLGLPLLFSTCPQVPGRRIPCLLLTYVSGPSRREADEIDQGCLLGRGQVEFLEQAGDRSSVLDLSQMLELASFFFDLSPNSGTEDPMFVALPASMGHRGGGRRDRSGVPG